MPSAIWVDAQLSPTIASWLPSLLELPVHAVRDLGLRDATDELIHQRARDADAVMLTKDADFTVLLERHGPPPRIIWLTCGNTSNARLRDILSHHRTALMSWLTGNEPLIEIC